MGPSTIVLLHVSNFVWNALLIGLFYLFIFLWGGGGLCLFWDFVYCLSEGLCVCEIGSVHKSGLANQMFSGYVPSLAAVLFSLPFKSFNWDATVHVTT